MTASAPLVLADLLAALAAEAVALGAQGSAQRLHELADELRATPSPDGVRSVAGDVADALEVARGQLDGLDTRPVYLLWRRASGAVERAAPPPLRLEAFA